jgi:hypothetical protein
MAIWDNVLRKFSERLASDVVGRMQVQPVIEARAYRMGYYNPQLRVMTGQFDDNIGMNYTGLIVGRIVSQMFGKGIKLDFDGETETPQEQYVERLLDANKQEVLFHRCAVSASEAGTGYMLILPSGVVGEDGVTYPRLQLLDPALVRMETAPEDYEMVIRYVITYKFVDADGKEKARKRVVEAGEPDEAGTVNNWTVTDYIQSGYNASWDKVSEEVWPYLFPPVIHWQNLPSVASAQGEPDVSANMIEMQNRINFIASNISKIIRLFAHPQRYAKMAGNMTKRMEVGPDEMPNFTDERGGIYQLEAIGDLASSLAFFNKLERAMFNMARVVDLSSYEDKIGSLTNFGLRVLYQDNLSLIGTKREIFGDMLEELARRLQIIAGMQPVECHVIWPDFLPVNEIEAAAAQQFDLTNGLASKQTIARERGRDWDGELARIADEKAGEDNLGAALLNAFNRGQ